MDDIGDIHTDSDTGMGWQIVGKLLLRPEVRAVFQRGNYRVGQGSGQAYGCRTMGNDPNFDRLGNNTRL